METLLILFVLGIVLGTITLFAVRAITRSNTKTDSVYEYAAYTEVEDEA